MTYFFKHERPRIPASKFFNSFLILFLSSFFARKIALVVLLTRAGLDLDPEALKKLYLRVITLGLVPWLLEATALALLSHYFLDFPWQWAMLLG